MLESALFRHDRVPGNVLHLANNGLTVEVSEAHTFRRNDGKVAISKEKQIAGVIQNRGNIGGDEVFVFAQPNDSRRAIAGGDNLVRFINRNYGQRKTPVSWVTVLRTASSSDGRCPFPVIHVVLLDHVGDDFGIGFGGELMSFFGELPLQRNVILDDPVMHDDDSPRAIAMRVSIFFSGTAVGGPAGMADSIGSIERLEADNFFEVAEFAFGAADLQAVTIAANRDTGGVITAIFEPPQTIQNDRYNPLLANISDNSAHDSLLLRSVWGGTERERELLILQLNTENLQ